MSLALRDSGDLWFRRAGVADAPAIAGLHARSWQQHYRGAYADAFLDTEAERYCSLMWTQRLGGPRQETCTVVAERDGDLLGFAHTFLNEDPRWGAFLDNLHVAHGLKRQGIGTRLLALTGQAVADYASRASSPGLYLWVLEQNAAARAFYAARGGACAQRDDVQPPGGDPRRLNGKPARLRYAWPDPAKLHATW
jgi:GNAT superfamily N-acetyltransferase